MDIILIFRFQNRGEFISMTKFVLNKKVIASSRCTLMQGQYDPDPFFCKIVLTEDAVILLNDELSKKDELLFCIPIYQIKEFTFINEKKQKKGKLKSLFEALFRIFLYVTGWLGLFPEYEKKEDILGLSFVNGKGENVDFILDMMKYGESGLVREYKKLI